MKKILCPADFSESADNAVVFAAELTRKVKGELVLLNVQHLMNMTPDEALVGNSLQMRSAEDRLEQRCHEIRSALKIGCSYEIATPVSAVVGVISEESEFYDLVVMGTDGTSSLKELIFGTHTYRTVRSTETPVLIIPQHASYFEPRHIVLAFDYLNANRLPLTQLLSFSQIFKSEITVLQVMDKPYDVKEDEKLDALQHWFEKMFARKSIHFETIYAKDPIFNIHHFMNRQPSSYLALCATHRSVTERLFDKSVIKNMSAFADFPIYVFHA